MLAEYFDSIDSDASGGISFAEMQSLFAGLATDSQLQAVIAALDANSDGEITQLELIQAGTDNVSAVKNSVDTVATEVDSVDATLTDEAKGAKWSKNTARAVEAVGEGIVPWVPEIVTRLYEIARFTAKGKDKPLNSEGRRKFWKKGSIPHDIFDANFVVAAAAHGGIIPGYAEGGVVANGIYNQDSVLARYANGGSVMLAGGEGVINAAATSMIGPNVIDLINATGRLPGGDNGPHFTMLAGVITARSDTNNRVLMAGFRAVVAELGERLERVEQAVTKQGQDTARAVRNKPVAKPQTRAA